jgi:light-regulated signal transduction histidine kinase (bacteriophytochrome)
MWVEDFRNSGRPSSSRNYENVEKLRKVIKNDRRRRNNDVQRRLREDITRKRAEEERTQDRLLHHANMPDRTASSFQHLVTENNTLSFPIKAQSPNLAQCDFFLFQKITIQEKGRCFGDIADIKAGPQTMLNTITKAGSSDASSSVRGAKPSVRTPKGDFK